MSINIVKFKSDFQLAITTQTNVVSYVMENLNGGYIASNIFDKNNYPIECGTFENFKTIALQCNGYKSGKITFDCSPNTVIYCYNENGITFNFTLPLKPHVSKSTEQITTEINNYFNETADGQLTSLFETINYDYTHENHKLVFNTQPTNVIKTIVETIETITEMTYEKLATHPTYKIYHERIETVKTLYEKHTENVVQCYKTILSNLQYDVIAQFNHEPLCRYAEDLFLDIMLDHYFEDVNFVKPIYRCGAITSFEKPTIEFFGEFIKQSNFKQLLTNFIDSPEFQESRKSYTIHSGKYTKLLFGIDSADKKKYFTENEMKNDFAKFIEISPSFTFETIFGLFKTDEKTIDLCVTNANDAQQHVIECLDEALDKFGK